MTTKMKRAMKTKIYLLPVLFCFFTFTLASCDDDDDNRHPGNDVVESAFNKMYPSASGVDWETKGGYFVVDFWQDGKEKEAWFDTNGEWYLTETDIRFDDLPEAVKTSHNAGEYASWHVDDVDMLERKDMEKSYVIEVEQGNKEYDLYYSTEGILIKAIEDNGNNNYLPDKLPQVVKTYIFTNYPNAKIIETEIEKSRIEVDIIDGNVHKELVFDTEGNWLYTKAEVRKEQVPQVVMTALQNSQYGSYKIDDIDYMETPEGNYYYFELESGDKDVYLKITPDGTII